MTDLLNMIVYDVFISVSTAIALIIVALFIMYLLWDSMFGKGY